MECTIQQSGPFDARCDDGGGQHHSRSTTRKSAKKGRLHRSPPSKRRRGDFPFGRDKTEDTCGGSVHRRLVLITMGVPANPNRSRKRLISARSTEKCSGSGRSVKTTKVGGRTEACVI